MFLYTDGITEAQKRAKEEYGMERLEEELSRNSRLSPEEFCDHLIREIKNWSSNSAPKDDITFLVIEFT